jgi:hypothetical protein
MAKIASGVGVSAGVKSVKKKTSIGKSVRSRPNSKNQKRSFKKYRGQGK